MTEDGVITEDLGAWNPLSNALNRTGREKLVIINADHQGSGLDAGQLACDIKTHESFLPPNGIICIRFGTAKTNVFKPLDQLFSGFPLLAVIVSAKIPQVSRHEIHFHPLFG